MCCTVLRIITFIFSLIALWQYFAYFNLCPVLHRGGLYTLRRCLNVIPIITEKSWKRVGCISEISKFLLILWLNVRLITWMSQLQILPPQPTPKKFKHRYPTGWRFFMSRICGNNECRPFQYLPILTVVGQVWHHRQCQSAWVDHATTQPSHPYL